MSTPAEAVHGIEATDACPTCRITATEFLDHLPQDAVLEVQARTTTRRIEAEDILCTTGEGARALHILRAGRMKVRDHGRVIKICRSGEILGGGAVAAGALYAVDVIALEDCQVDTVTLAPSRLRAIVAEAIAECADTAHHQPLTKAIVLSAESIARIARIVAGLGCFAGEGTDDGLHVPLTLSHQGIGQLLALPETAVDQIFEELETRGILYADATGITILGTTRKEVDHETTHHSL